MSAESEERSDCLQVDVDKVLRDKNPRLAHWLPRFVTAYLKRIVHQDDVNFILQSYSQLPPIEFARATLNHMDISYTATGLADLPREGRYLFASNHPFGGMDGLMLCDELERHFGSSRIIVNDILMNLKPLAPLFVPVNKHGRQNSDYARQFREALAGGDPIATFPAGLCSRRIKGTVHDLPWKPSFIKNAIDSRRDVVPVYFEGRLSNFFYNLSNLRTALGIKANLEMLYLVDEMFAQHGKRFNILFGTPIPWEKLTTEHTPAEWAQRVEDTVYTLPESIRG